ncbi:helix-turn-helix transcriptional regulator [Micromonospora sp. NPDC049081]|uniref:helix-turn-helix domain-containing protein n=1 Tax=Micromonospora sp. NPDC049081 TaxID=3155150 RepID=UPI0033E26C77
MYETPPPRTRSGRGAQRGQAFAALIVAARRRHGLTQDDVIVRSKVSRSTLLRWEAGDATRPNPDHVRAVCNAVGVDQRDALMALGYLTTDEIAPAA